MSTPAQRWRRTASVPPAALRPGATRSRQARLAAAALNGSVVVLDNAKRIALSSATGLLALSSVALGTYAGFSAQVSNPGNTFATGSVAVEAYVGAPDSPVGGAFGFGAISDLLPGEQIVRFLDIENTGTLPLRVDMTSSAAASSLLDTNVTDGIRLEIKRCAGAAWTAVDSCPLPGVATTIYASGRVAPLLDPADNDAVVSLGTVEPGAASAARYQLRATLPASATALTAQSSTLQFTWTASNTTS